MRGVSSVAQAPYLELSVPGQKNLKTKAARTPSCTDPNFVQMIKVSLAVPEDPLYPVVVNLRAMDKRFGAPSSLLLPPGLRSGLP